MRVRVLVCAEATPSNLPVNPKHEGMGSLKKPEHDQFNLNTTS